MLNQGSSAQRLAEMIKHAIEDGQVTNTEFDRIMMIADEDHHIDAQEKKLLAQLHDMIENGTVRRVAG